MNNIYQQFKSVLSMFLSMLILFTNSISAFAVDEPNILTEVEYYRAYIATPLDEIYYKISENIPKTATIELSACSMYGPGSISVPGENGGSPGLCWVAGQWGACDNSCGTGIASRDVKCLDLFSVVSTGCLEKLRLASTKGCEDFSVCQYSWDYSVWGSCSSGCGNGIQSRTASCERSDGKTVDNSFCVEELVLTKPCFETSSCIYVWEYDEWGSCSTTCGAGTKTRTSSCLRSDGVIVDDQDCDDVRTNSQACIDISTCTSSWDYGSWGACSTTCGNGTQSRAATCLRSDGTIVANTECTGSQTISQTCSDTTACTYSWNTTTWGSCSNTCGTGTQTRTSTCKRSDGTTVADTFCPVKPSGSQACTDVSTCTYSWDTTAWGSCSTTCGTGTQTRVSTCKRSDGTTVADSFCATKPVSSQSCTNVSTCTTAWNYGSWGSCSTTCGTGTQSRSATCLRSDGTTVANSNCTATAITSQTCTNVSTCTYSWNTTSWGSCSNTCGTGTQTRTSICKRSDGTTVADTFCPAKPSGSQACTDVSTCTYIWNTTAWGSCSTTCGTGTQTRTSTCKRSDGTTVLDTFCTAKPSGSQSCTNVTTCTTAWNYGSWGACSTTCGTGTQSRSATCLRSDGTTVVNSNCTGTPTTSQSCSNVAGCTYNWSTTAWGGCSTSCGTGAQYRSSTCVRSDGVAVVDGYCSAKPVGSQSCSVYTGCTYTPSYSAYGACSTTCPNSTKSRTAQCWRSDGALVSNAYCALTAMTVACPCTEDGCYNDDLYYFSNGVRLNLKEDCIEPKKCGLYPIGTYGCKITFTGGEKSPE